MATFRNQVASILAATEHFALFGYHSNATLSIKSGTAECCVYFYNKRKKESIKMAMQCFADERDKIEFNEFKKTLNGKFYTIKLIKKLEL